MSTTSTVGSSPSIRHSRISTSPAASGSSPSTFPVSRTRAFTFAPDETQHSRFGILRLARQCFAPPSPSNRSAPELPLLLDSLLRFLPTRDRLLPSVLSGPTATASTEMHPTDAVARAPRHTGPVGAVK